MVHFKIGWHSSICKWFINWKSLFTLLPVPQWRFCQLRTRPRSILMPVLPNLRRLLAVSSPEMTIQTSQLLIKFRHRTDAIQRKTNASSFCDETAELAGHRVKIYVVACPAMLAQQELKLICISGCRVSSRRYFPSEPGCRMNKTVFYRSGSGCRINNTGLINSVIFRFLGMCDITIYKSKR